MQLWLSDIVPRKSSSSLQSILLKSSSSMLMTRVLPFVLDCRVLMRSCSLPSLCQHAAVFDYDAPALARSLAVEHAIAGLQRYPRFRLWRPRFAALGDLLAVEINGKLYFIVAFC